MKRIILIIVMALALCGCGKKNPIVTMEIENLGEAQIELYPGLAPNTVANFINLIEDGFYDGLTFHRLVPGFILQGGSPEGDSFGGPSYSIKGEFATNGFSKNNLSHTKGVISMARGEDKNSAGSQFFIVLNDAAKSSLDKKYAGFGKVIKGMDIFEKIEETAEVSDTTSGKLKENIKITKMTVDTFDKEYKVEKLAER